LCSTVSAAKQQRKLHAKPVSRRRCCLTVKTLLPDVGESLVRTQAQSALTRSTFTTYHIDIIMGSNDTPEVSPDELKWLQEWYAKQPEPDAVTEEQAAKALEQYRAEQNALKDDTTEVSPEELKWLQQWYMKQPNPDSITEEQAALALETYRAEQNQKRQQVSSQATPKTPHAPGQPSPSQRLVHENERAESEWELEHDVDDVDAWDGYEEPGTRAGPPRIVVPHAALSGGEANGRSPVLSEWEMDRTFSPAGDAASASAATPANTLHGKEARISAEHSAGSSLFELEPSSPACAGVESSALDAHAAASAGDASRQPPQPNASLSAAQHASPDRSTPACGEAGSEPPPVRETSVASQHAMAGSDDPRGACADEQPAGAAGRHAQTACAASEQQRAMQAAPIVVHTAAHASLETPPRPQGRSNGTVQPHIASRPVVPLYSPDRLFETPGPHGRVRRVHKKEINELRAQVRRGVGPVAEHIRSLAHEQMQIALKNQKHASLASTSAASEAEWWACLLHACSLAT